MKKIYLLAAAFVCLQFSTLVAQTTSYSVFADSLVGCQTTLGIAVSIGTNPETGGVFTVDWGDGTIDNLNFTSVTGNTTAYYQIQHGYAVGGNYTATYNVFSGTAGANVDAGQSDNLFAYGPSNCGYAYIYTYQTNPGVNYYSVPYDFTDANGNITTVVPNNSNPGSMGYFGLNPANAPYIVSINPAWLAGNGLVQSSSNITITSFNSNGMANPSQLSFSVTCSIAAQNPDFSINYGFAMNFVAPLQSGHLYANICNLACSDTSDVTVSLEMPAGFVPNTTGLTNASVNGNILSFDILALSECFYLNLPFTFPGNTPAGTPFCFYMTLTNPNDTYLANNTDTICGIVLNSYDPNDKQVNLGEHIVPNQVEELQYVIHFQNDGNLNAYNVVVQDTISTNLDLSTFKLVGSKHGVATSVNPTTRVVTFTFNNIDLAQSAVDLDASQGFVVYTISENAGLGEGTEITNTAYIYFDFNPAIITNTTSNLNTTLGVNEKVLSLISVYPNPATDRITFKGATVSEVSVFDLSGKLKLNEKISNNTVAVNSLSNGIYQLVLTTESGISYQKLVIQK